MDGSTLGYNLITSHQVECMPSVLVPSEAVENDQERMSLLHFRIPHSFVIDDSSWRNAAESFTVALTLTLGGTKVQ